jgi:hypothetical protein
VPDVVEYLDGLHDVRLLLVIAADVPAAEVARRATEVGEERASPRDD